MNIIQSPSPNFSRSSYTKVGVQIHKTLGLMPSTLAWLRNPRSFASAHFLVTKAGVIHSLVDISHRSWTSGRINLPSPRGKAIMMKSPIGRYVKPGHYLIQIEYECLSEETYTEEQYNASVELFKTFPFKVTQENLLTHQDTCSYKPNLEAERIHLLARYNHEDSDVIPLLEEAINILKNS